MRIVGICGQKRHGKDTVGGILKDEQRYTPIAFADPIKRIAMEIYGFSYAQCFGDLKEVPDERWEGLTPRHAMQQIGTEMGRSIHNETWIRFCLATIKKAARGEEPLIHWADAEGFVPASAGLVNLDLWAITDVRFPNEADCIRKAGGKVIKVVRPSLVGTQGDSHASETNIDNIEPDYLVLNDGTLDELADKVREFVPEL